MSQELIQQKAKSLKSLLELSKKEVEAALPKHLTSDRLLRIAMTEARKVPKLLECTQASFLGAIIQAAQVGLEPGGALGHCYLVPYGREVQLIVGYRGFLELANRSDRVSSVIARAVYDGDQFSFEFGLNESLVHKPGDASKRGQLTHVYCVVTMKDGAKMFDVMAKAEVDAVRTRSKASGSGPWVSDYEAMAKKTVVRRLFKFMPASIEIQKAVGLDELGETDQGQNLGDILETEGRTIPEGGAEDLKARIAAQKQGAQPAGESSPAPSGTAQPSTPPLSPEPSPSNWAERTKEMAAKAGHNPDFDREPGSDG